MGELPNLWGMLREEFLTALDAEIARHADVLAERRRQRYVARYRRRGR